MASKNLRGDLTEVETVRRPKALLLEQAQYLTTSMEGVLVGNVDVGNDFHGRFAYDLNIEVPSLNGYIYTVLSIVHDVDLYPVMVDTAQLAKPLKCDNEQEFESAIESILQSAHVKRIVSRLLSQVT